MVDTIAHNIFYVKPGTSEITVAFYRDTLGQDIIYWYDPRSPFFTPDTFTDEDDFQLFDPPAPNADEPEPIFESPTIVGPSDDFVTIVPDVDGTFTDFEPIDHMDLLPIEPHVVIAIVAVPEPVDPANDDLTILDLPDIIIPGALAIGGLGMIGLGVGILRMSFKAVGAALKGSRNLGGGGSLLTRGLQFLGFATAGDFILSQFGIDLIGPDADFANQLTDHIERGLMNGEILAPENRDGTPMAMNYLHVNLDNGQMWMTPEYTSKKTVRAARNRERTAGFRGRGGRRQARTK